MKSYSVYILAGEARTLYIGVTSDLKRRVYEHKHKLNDGFTNRYNICKLVYFESTTEVHAAIQREKRLKWWPREWKIKLIETSNPEWLDLAEDWYAEGMPEEMKSRDSGHSASEDYSRSPE
jgi:putative endonuclease